MVEARPRVTPRTIREWRVEQDLTQEELAEKLGVSQATVADWEREQVGPKGGWLRFWALLFAGGFTVGVVEGFWEEFGPGSAERQRRGPRGR